MEKHIEVRMKAPSLFIADSFKVIQVAGVEGVKANVGRLTEDSTDDYTVQSFFFLKDSWDMKRAESWMDSNKSIKDEEDRGMIHDIQVDDEMMKDLQFEVKAVDGKDNQFDYIASTEDIDRDGDVIRVAGWNFKNFLKNPVILYAHGRMGDHALPVAKAIKLTKDRVKKQLIIRVEFASKEVYEFADQVRRLVAGGFMNACSVRFKTIEKRQMMKEDYPDDYSGWMGWEIKKAELVELSPTPIPCNQDAVLLDMMKSCDSSTEKFKDVIAGNEKLKDFLKGAEDVEVEEIEQAEQKTETEKGKTETKATEEKMIVKMDELINVVKGALGNVVVTEEKTLQELLDEHNEIEMEKAAVEEKSFDKFLEED